MKRKIFLWLLSILVVVASIAIGVLLACLLFQAPMWMITIFAVVVVLSTILIVKSQFKEEIDLYGDL